MTKLDDLRHLAKAQFQALWQVETSEGPGSRAAVLVRAQLEDACRNVVEEAMRELIAGDFIETCPLRATMFTNGSSGAF